MYYKYLCVMIGWHKIQSSRVFIKAEFSGSQNNISLALKKVHFYVLQIAIFKCILKGTNKLKILCNCGFLDPLRSNY